MRKDKLLNEAIALRKQVSEVAKIFTAFQKGTLDPEDRKIFGSILAWTNTADQILHELQDKAPPSPMNTMAIGMIPRSPLSISQSNPRGDLAGTAAPSPPAARVGLLHGL